MITADDERRERRLRRAGVLLLAGLVVEAGSLVWAHPTAFLTFALGGGSLVAAGVLLYLHALVAR